MGDILQWDQSNKNYILTHGVSGVDWRFYKHPMHAHVYDVYMKSKKEISREDDNFVTSCTPRWLILKSNDFSKSVSCAFRACEEVSLFLDTRGIEIVMAVFILDNFIQFSFKSGIYVEYDQ
jgi:hypothetical protein